jgi:hypothetical protein
VELQDFGLGNLAALCQAEKEVEGLGVPDGLEMVSKGLPSDGDPILDDDLGFALCKAVSLQGVTGPGQADLVILPQRGG